MHWVRAGWAGVFLNLAGPFAVLAQTPASLPDETTRAPASALSVPPPAKVVPPQEGSIRPEDVCAGLPMTSYVAKKGDTAESVAHSHSLRRETLLGANPAIQNRPLQSGDRLLLLPRDGILYKPQRGEGFPEIAARFRVRGDLLFEMNGCQMRDALFVPGVVWTPPPPPKPKQITPRPASVPAVAPVLKLPPPPLIPLVPPRPVFKSVGAPLKPPAPLKSDSAAPRKPNPAPVRR
ncbi:LysM peptidoglycan-binding domain-containing protein [Gloeobacter kilaueensis]|uniref:LysM domain-containing protein n=1 Tax=Gloeobacter kilaueensis (strain ATCC BAA-2537 / CCAP 1431/1 / ULC 316 / JS1) TaxID=1183438 RepID=U5QGM5_GLOK1|nr:LysM domain-containing protein [Gloeobacter kilaueensis]AGY58122.1 hypothetical protein GKIL_1876 [Gloeobacter kilaueensis JS1]